MYESLKGSRCARIGAALAAVCLAVVARGADTWWVDANSQVTEETGADDAPFKTIQAAINASSTKAGDTIRVRPGVYTNGFSVSDTTSTNRVRVTKKLTIVSTLGKEVTHIVGRHSSDPTYEGCGRDAVRCVCFDSGSAGSVLEGFTLRDGGAQYDSQGGNYAGGGVFVRAENTLSDIRIVDCVVSNCAGTRGAALCGNQNSSTTWAIRTLICNNRAPGSGTKSILRFMNLFSSVVAHNSSVAYTCDYPNLTVNCTFFENYQGYELFQGKACAVLNSILMTHRSGGNQSIGHSSAGMETYVTNCIANTGKGPKELVNSITDASREQLKGSAVGGALLMPIASSPAVGFGNVDYLQRVPSEYRDKDFYGNARTTDGKVNAGAVEGSAPAAASGGFAYFNGTCTVRGLGGVYQQNDYYHPDSVPAMVKASAVAPEGLHLYKYTLSSAYSATHYPERDGSFGLYIPSSDKCVEVTPVFTGRRLFVDVNDAGEEAEIDGTSDHPYKTIMAAIAAASAATNTIIDVAEGTYSTGEGATDCYGFRRVVIDKPVFIRGAGRDRSFIRGAPATGASTTASPWGCGSDAVACVIAKNAACALQGFTLSDGYTRPEGSYAQIRGGGFFEVTSDGARGSGRAHLLDCTATNCVATRSAAFGGGCRAFRCLVAGCRHTNNGICQDGCKLFGCVLTGNLTGDIVGNTALAYNCTIDGTGVNGWLMNPSACCYNSIFVGTSGNSVPGASENRSNGSIRFGASASAAADYPYCDAVALDPSLVDPARRDYRLLSITAALGFGDMGYVDATMMSSGYDGSPVVFKDGRLTPGALQDFVPCFALSSSDGSQKTSTFSVTVNGSATSSLTNSVQAGDAVTIAYASARHLDHFEVDGVACPTGTTQLDLTVPDDVSAGWGRIVAVLGNTYYVSANRPDDSGNGWTPETAKRTLVSALNLAISGDVVHVAEGTYSEGEGDQGFMVYLGQAERTVRARAPVPAGVRLVADGAAERTIIEGGKAPAATARDSEGMGPGAVRCVSLSSGASVEGFTIAGGRCLIPEGATLANPINPPTNEDYCGGGVLGVAVDEVSVIGCIITNCCGCRGGAGWRVRFTDCRILGNLSCWNAPAGSVCQYYGCLIDGNKGENTSQECTGYYGCTYGPNNGYGTNHYSYDYVLTAKTTPVVASRGVKIRNTVFLQEYYSTDAGTGGQPSCCAIVRSAGTPPNPDTWSNAVVVTSRDALKLDANFRPCKDSPLIDAGDRAAWEGARDLEGGQRVYNGQIDIGAFEYDWRKDYAADLGTRRFAVTNATTDVYEKTVDEKKVVALPSAGGTLTGVWTPIANGSADALPCRMTATLTAAGTLEVLKNGAAYATFTDAGRHDICAEGTVNGDAFSFVWTPSDATAEAYLSNFSCQNGIVLLLR